MKMPNSQTTAQILSLILFVGMILGLARGCEKNYKTEKAKKQVNEALKKPYYVSDSVVDAMHKDSLRAAYERVKRERFAQ